MRPKSLIIAILLLGFRLSGAETSHPEFRGTFTEGENTVFSLLDTRSGEASWVGLGQRFKGLELVSFDRKNEELALRDKQGAIVRIRLASAQLRTTEAPKLLSREAAKAYLLTPIPDLTKAPEASEAEAAALGYRRGSRSLSELSDAEAAKLVSNLAKAEPLNSAANAAGYPVGWVPFTRESLPIEVSFNLTDGDLQEINQKTKEQLDRALIPLLKEIDEKIKREVATPR